MYRDSPVDAMAWLTRRIGPPNEMLSWTELQVMKNFVRHWDAGAVRTVVAYYRGREGEKIGLDIFCWHYMKEYYNKELSEWVVRNPNAAAVQMCRDMDMSPPRHVYSVQRSQLWEVVS